MTDFALDAEAGGTPGRTLALLALLQQRPSWPGAELAGRLGVTDRTVRRDVDRLRSLGYPVEAAPGVAGGYQLGRGGRLPPLLLGDDEALAVAVGLRAAIDGNVTGLEDAALAVLTRLDSLLPPHLARRVRSLHATTTAPTSWAGEQVGADLVVGLAQACDRSERVRFAYADKAGRGSDRLVEPHRLVRVGPRWYLMARDVDRRDWRTFRVDRMAGLEQVGTPFVLVDPPEAGEFVRRSLRTRSWPYEARIRLEVAADEAAELLPGAVTLTPAGPAATEAVVGAMGQERMVRYLAGLPRPCSVLDPPALRLALRRHLTARLEANPADG